jgi:hypothetical protein
MTPANPVSHCFVSDPNLKAVDLIPTATSSFLSFFDEKKLKNIHFFLSLTLILVT